jgi:hypothetical protein
MDEDKLPVALSEGLSSQELIEIKEQDSVPAEGEDAVIQAVQVLNSLATLKLKVQELRDEALKVRAQIDILFTDESVSEEEIATLKEGFKVLKNFAGAEQARAVLDEALKTPKT